MFGFDINAMNIYVRSYVGDPLYLVWSKLNPQGDIWHKAEINLDHIQNNYQVLPFSLCCVYYITFKHCEILN